MSGEDRQHRRVGEHRGVDLHVDVVEAGVEEQVAVGAGDAGVGRVSARACTMPRVSAGWSESITRVSQSWPSSTIRPPGEDPAGFGQRGVRVRQDVVHLVRPVPARLPVRERQVGGTRGAYVDVGEPGAGGGQHRRIQVHTDRAGALSSQFGDRPPVPQPTSRTVAPGASRSNPQVSVGLPGDSAVVPSCAVWESASGAIASSCSGLCI